MSSNENTPFAPFALDNNVNLRGVGILVDRGTGSFVLNTEYRHTIYDKKWLAIQTNVFTDFGSWRNPGGKLNDFFQEENLFQLAIIQPYFFIFLKRIFRFSYICIAFF